MRPKLPHRSGYSLRAIPLPWFARDEVLSIILIQHETISRKPEAGDGVVVP